MNSEKSESRWCGSFATIPPLHDPARQTAARKKKPGRSDRDDGEEKDTGGSLCYWWQGQAEWRRQIITSRRSKNRKPRAAWYSWFLRYWDQENVAAVAVG